MAVQTFTPLPPSMQRTLEQDFAHPPWTQATVKFWLEWLKILTTLWQAHTLPRTRKITGITPLAESQQTVLNFFPPSGSPAPQAYSFVVPLDWQVGTDLTWYYDIRVDTVGGSLAFTYGVTVWRPGEAPGIVVPSSTVLYTPLVTYVQRSMRTIPGTGLQPGDRLVLELYRLSNDASDTNTGNGFLVGQDITYTGVGH